MTLGSKVANPYCAFLERSFTFIVHLISIIFVINGKQLLQISNSLYFKAS